MVSCNRLWPFLCRDPGSNRGPSDLRSDALPTELSRRRLPQYPGAVLCLCTHTLVFTPSLKLMDVVLSWQQWIRFPLYYILSPTLSLKSFYTCPPLFRHSTNILPSRIVDSLYMHLVCACHGFRVAHAAAYRPWLLDYVRLDGCILLRRVASRRQPQSAGADAGGSQHRTGAHYSPYNPSTLVLHPSCPGPFNQQARGLLSPVTLSALSDHSSHTLRTRILHSSCPHPALCPQSPLTLNNVASRAAVVNAVRVASRRQLRFAGTDAGGSQHRTRAHFSPYNPSTLVLHPSCSGPFNLPARVLHSPFTLSALAHLSTHILRTLILHSSCSHPALFPQSPFTLNNVASRATS